MRVAEAGRLSDDRGMLLTCQTGYQDFLAREIEEAGGSVLERGPGWVRGAFVRGERPDLAFAHLGLIAPVEIAGDSVNVLAQRVGEYFLTGLRGERVGAEWPSVWLGPHEIVGLGRRVGAVETAFGVLLKKRLSRVARLAVPGDSILRANRQPHPHLPDTPVAEANRPAGGGSARGLFVYFADFGRAFVTREAWTGGQRRMADDALAPSRSYLKVEEAYGVLGREPQAGEVVVDLGAAPGGWSYSAAKRGARVIAVDNGPLKGGALGHPLIEHRQADAFGFRPDPATGADWLCCDLVEEPHHVLRGIITPWLEGRWCRRFVINLKFGRVDPVSLLRELRATDSVLARCAAHFWVRHLYHDREEFTVVGEVRPRVAPPSPSQGMPPATPEPAGS